MHLDTAFIAFYDRAGGANIDASTLLETFTWYFLLIGRVCDGVIVFNQT